MPERWYKEKIDTFFNGPRQYQYAHRMNNATDDSDPPTPNRWYTTVSVEIYINNRLRYIKWFSDLQMAYIWVTIQERVNNEPLTYNRNFVEFADAFDRRWQQRPNEGCTMATSSTYRYKLTYEPDVPHRPQEEQTIQPQQAPFVFHP